MKFIKLFINKFKYNKNMEHSLNFIKNSERQVITTEDMEVFQSYVKQNEGKKIVATHSGAFHADEVLATTLTKYSTEFRDSWIVRSRNYEIHKLADLVCDVGGIHDPSTHRYDHHMKEFTLNFDEILKIKMSSAGLVYKHLGKNIIENLLKEMNIYEQNKNNLQKIYDKIYVNFIAYVDGADNGINQYPEGTEVRYINTTSFGSRVSRTNPEWTDENPNQSECFQKAQDIAEDEFYHQLKHVVRAYLPAYSIVKSAIENRFNVHQSGKVMFLEKSCTWKELLFEIEEELGLSSEVYFVIYKVKDTDFRCQTVPLTPGNFKFRKGLHEEWRGMEKEKLAEISGIEDINFVHTSGFIGGARSYASALKMADLSLKH